MKLVHFTGFIYPDPAPPVALYVASEPSTNLYELRVKTFPDRISIDAHAADLASATPGTDLPSGTTPITGGINYNLVQSARKAMLKEIEGYLIHPTVAEIGRTQWHPEFTRAPVTGGTSPTPMDLRAAPASEEPAPPPEDLLSEPAPPAPRRRSRFDTAFDPTRALSTHPSAPQPAASTSKVSIGRGPHAPSGDKWYNPSPHGLDAVIRLRNPDRSGHGPCWYVITISKRGTAWVVECLWGNENDSTPRQAVYSRASFDAARIMAETRVETKIRNKYEIVDQWFTAMGGA